jgi:hypothetical protein
VLLALLPFEPRRQVTTLGVHTTLLEALAAVCLVTLAVVSWRDLLDLARRPPLPVVLLGAYAAAHLVAAVVAAADPAAAFKFALRMLVMAGCAALVAVSPAAARRRALLALAVSAAVVALLAVLEEGGVRSLDGLLALFRESPVNVGGWRRATAGSEYPNLAAAILMYGLLAGVGVASEAGAAVLPLLAWSGLVAWGLLCTYSRGALVAAICALVGIWVGRGILGRSVRLAGAALATLLVATSVTSWGGEAYRLRFGGEGTTRWYAAAYAPGESWLRLAPGQQHLTSVRVTNLGRRTWSAQQAFHLSYHWYDHERHLLGEGSRSSLPRDVAPGESVTLEAEVRAPGGEGEYLLEWDMVHEHTTWFSDQGVRPEVVPVVVAPQGRPVAAPLAVSLPAPIATAWVPGRAELWRIALTMWRSRPWLGYGPDSFRQLYGPLAGHRDWDPRVFANNTLLEAAATTGTLGLLSLGGALAAALWSSWRGLVAGAAGATAAFALLLGLAVHGLVDYVIAFTGHYLLFGFAVGAAAALGRRDAG